MNMPGRPMEPQTLKNQAELVAEWADFMTHNRGLSPATVKEYTRHVTNALKALPPLELLTKREITAFIVHEQSRGISVESTNFIIKALNNFFGWLTEEKGIEQAALSMRTRARPRKVPRALSADDCFAILEFEKASGHWTGLRNRALWMLMWGSGLRISEALSFTLGDTREQRQSLLITGKGRKQRMVVVLPRVWSAINDYLSALGMQCPAAAVTDDTPLFVRHDLAPLSAVEAAKEFTKVREALELPADASPHALRHSFATHLLNSDEPGAPTIRDVQELMGHSSISTTAIYANVANARLFSQYDAAHPRGSVLPTAGSAPVVDHETKNDAA